MKHFCFKHKDVKNRDYSRNVKKTHLHLREIKDYKFDYNVDLISIIYQNSSQTQAKTKR